MEQRSELLRLLSELCDEQLTEAKQARLEELLTSEEARQVYLQYVDMHARLLTHPAVAGPGKLPGVNALAGVIGEEAVRAGADSRTSRTERHRGRSLQVLSYAAVAAATL